MRVGFGSPEWIPTSGLVGFGIKSPVKSFDSMLLHIVHIIPMEFGPVIRNTIIRWYTILSRAILSIAIEIAFAI
jgi:hypothetical protein